MIASLGVLLLAASTALAGGGPWTLPTGSRNLYVGTTQTRFSNITSGDDSIDVGTVQATTLQAIGTIGLLEGIEAELAVPWTRANHLEPALDICQSTQRPSDFCQSSASLAPLQFTLKGRLLDEGALRPVTLSTAVSLRAGNTTAQYRDRLTATGDGQTDVGLRASVGRTGGFRTNGWYRLAASAAYWYRTPLAVNDGQKVPADQVEFALGGVIAPTRRIGLGPLLTGFHRLGGIDLSETRPDDPNAFPALAASQIKAGGELAITGDQDITVSISALSAVWARNNPSDTRVISVGLGWYQKPRKP